MNHYTRQFMISLTLAGCLVVASNCQTQSTSAAPVSNPALPFTFEDAITGDSVATRSTDASGIGDVNYNASGNGGRFSNAQGQVTFDIDQFQPGSATQRADDYLKEVYERPTDQTYFNQTDGGGNIRFGLDSGGVKYYSYLDIENVQVGFDSTYLYVSMDLFGRNSFNTGSGASNGENKLQGFYGFRIGENPADPQSRGGYFIRFQNATDNAGTTFDLDPTASIFRDVNNNVGGNSINGTIASTLEGGGTTGDGYEIQVVADGKTNGSGGFASGLEVLYTRINPSNNTKVEFALDYTVFGFTQADLIGPNLYLLFQATEGRNDASDPFFNDHYNFQGAGTPNPDLRGIAGPNSVYQTNGLSGNIYRLDTLLAGPLVPEPTSILLMGLGGYLILNFARRQRVRNS